MIHQEKTWNITNSQVKEYLSCSDTEGGVVWHWLTLKGSESKYIRASGTDVFVLMHYALRSSTVISRENVRLMKTDSEIYISATFIRQYFRENMYSV